MKKWTVLIASILFILPAWAMAQGPGPGGGPGSGPDRGPREKRVYRQEIREGGPDMLMHVPGPMKWWKDSETIKQLGLSDEQAKKIERSYVDHKMKLIDIMADLQKQELKMETLMNDDHPDDNQIISQVDQVVQARGRLEKENAVMMLDMRRVLTTEQWHKLQSMEPGMGFGPRIFIKKFDREVHRGPMSMNGPMPPPPPDMDEDQ